MHCARYRDPDGKEVSETQNKYFLMYGDVKVDRTKEVRWSPGQGMAGQDIVEERRWRKWVDDTLVHTLSPNVYRTPSEVISASGKVHFCGSGAS
jgi:microsomal prostaglandin-E synthase 2